MKPLPQPKPKTLQLDVNSLSFREAIEFEQRAGMSLAEFFDRNSAATVTAEQIQVAAVKLAKGAGRTKATKADREQAAATLDAARTPFYPSSVHMAALAFVAARRDNPGMDWEDFLDGSMAEAIQIEMSDNAEDPTHAGD